MISCGASRGAPQAVTHGAELPDGAVQFVRFGGEPLAIDPRPAMRRHHARNLIERETRGAAQRDQRQTFQHARREETTKAPPAE